MKNVLKYCKYCNLFRKYNSDICNICNINFYLSITDDNYEVVKYCNKCNIFVNTIHNKCNIFVNTIHNKCSQCYELYSPIIYNVKYNIVSQTWCAICKYNRTLIDERCIVCFRGNNYDLNYNYCKCVTCRRSLIFSICPKCDSK
jgi:hypothetical protein